MNTGRLNLPGLIEEQNYGRSELHGFEIDMSGRVVVPEFHPPTTPEALTAFIELHSELCAAIEAAA